MKVTPTPEQWALLTTVERWNFKFIDAINRTPFLRWLISIPKSTLGMAWCEFVISNLCHDHGFDSFKRLDPNRGVLLVANHRSFFDLYAVSARLYRLFGNHHYIFFPVRSTFFYTNVLGMTVNLPVGQASMYPPILREKERREWNRFVTDLLVELLQDSRNMVGFHPEGTRNKLPDPYELLPAKPGCGELIYRARPNVVPLFQQGFPRFAWQGVWQNRLPKRYRPTWTHMVMGDAMDFTEEYKLPDCIETYQKITDKVMARIKELSEEEKGYRAAEARERAAG